MGNPKAFLTIHRQEAGYRPVHDRIEDFSEVEQTLNSADRKNQASRCMDCGVPFCHWACPVGNKQPEWQDLLYRGKWREAYMIWAETCDFPEFTGRICPALCEKSCVLKLSADEPVTIRENEAAIMEAAFREGYVKPVSPKRNGKKVAVVGSGPAGLTVANRLNHKGYEVTVYEKHELPGGLLRFGIPNFKLSKVVIDRRIRLMREEGINFVLNTEIGKDIPAKEQLVEELCQVKGMTSISYSINQEKTNVIMGKEIVNLYGPGYITDNIGNVTYQISPLSFYQVNPVQTEKLYGTALEYAGLTGKEKVIDAYCGTGTIGLIAASQAKEVIGVELNRDAVKDAVINAKRNNIKNEQFYNADAGKFMVELSEQNKKVDVVFMDPPRAGSDEAFLSSVVKLAPKKVVYVSCNPETLARDLKYLTRHGYQAVECQPCDMFPFTKHVETVCLLSRKAQ